MSAHRSIFAAPEGGARLIRAHLEALAMVPQLQRDFFDGVAAEALELGAPLPVFSVGLDAICRGELTAAAAHTHWHYLVSAAATARPLAAAALGRWDGQWRFAGVHRGLLTAAVVHAVAFAKTTPEWRAGVVDLRLVQVPALASVLLWLCPRASDEHAFIAVADPEHQFVYNALVDERAALRGLGELARDYQPLPP